MKSSKNSSTFTIKKIKVLTLLLFTLIIPMIINSPLFSILHDGNFKEDDNKDITDETKLTPKLNAPINAHYFNHYKIITIDHNQVSGTSGFTNFPFLISIFDKDLRFDVQSDGDDIAFSSNNVWLDHEIELFDQTYNGTHAQLVVWIRIPALLVSIDTIIRMYYSNSTMSSRENPDGVWDSDYEGVYHLNDDFLDSTSNNRDGINTGSVDATGRIGHSQDFEHDDGSDNINIGSWSVSGSMITIQAWVKYESFDSWGWGSSYSDARILSKNSGISDGGDHHVWMLGTYNRSLDEDGPYNLRGRIKTGTNDTIGTTTVHATLGDLSIDTWYLTTIKYDDSNIYLVLDGNTILTQSKTGSLRINNWPITIGNSPTGSRAIDALIDEVRVSSTGRSNNWLKTEYNNQNNPATFYSIGTEQLVVWEPPNAHYFTYYKIITIDHTKITGTGIHTNFPFLISLIDEDLRYHAQPDGDDIAFAADGDWLDHEIELFNQTYSSTQAQLIAWVQLPYLHTTKNTTIAMYYGNSTMSSRQNPTGVWDNNYKGVWHLRESPTGTSGEIRDSTSINNGTSYGSMSSNNQLTGQVDGSLYFDGSNDYINCGDIEDITDEITVEAWVKLAVAQKPNWPNIVGKSSEYRIYHDSDRAGYITFYVRTTSGQSYPGQYDLPIDTWLYVVGRYDGNFAEIFINGNKERSNSLTGTIIQTSNDLRFARSGTSSTYFNGSIDEIRISNIARSDDWIATQYDNQNDPSSFGTVGVEQLVNDITPNADYFDYHKIITIDHTKVNGIGSHVNFPFLVSLLDKDLRNDVQSDGDDIAFSMDGQWLDHQIELFNKTYNSTHAQLIAWVRIPFLFTVVDTEITIHYGNSTMNSRQNPTGVWGNYKSVWHFSEPTGTGDYIKDSTSNNYDGTPFGTQFLDSGQIDGSRSFSGTGDNRIIINQGSEFFNGDNIFTYSFWIYPNYVSDAEWEASERTVFYKQSSVRLSRLYRQNWMDAGEGRYQADIQFETYGTTYLNVTLFRQQWAYITYCYDGNYLRAYVNGQLGSSANIGGFPLITDTSSFYFGSSFNSFKGYLDEFRASNTAKSEGWVATEYYNQFNPTTFFNISSEKHSKPVVEVDVLINAVDLYGNLLPNVTISMYQFANLIETDITATDGTVSFTNIFAGEYNFTASISSDIASVTEIVNSTSQAILLDQVFQTINIICDVGTHFFEVIDIDGSPLESGWIMVGNDTHTFKKCYIDPTGHTKFWWVDAPPSQYNYSIYYNNALYNPSTLTLVSGDITTVNATIQVQVELTTVEFTVQTINAPITPVSGAKLKLTVDDPLGASIVNLTTDINGQAKLRWLNSSGIGGNYSLQIEFFGVNRLFNETLGGPATVYNISFTVVNKDSLESRILIDLSKFQTELISLNPTDYIKIEWGSVLKLRSLFNVSLVETGYESLLGPTYADLMTYEMLLGGEIVQSGTILEEVGNTGRHYIEIDTKQVNSDEKYIIIISAYKSGFTIPSDLILQLDILKNELEVNQSDNDDSALTTYWLESVNMTLNSYGTNSETLSVENALFQSVDHEFSFLISDVQNHWNLSKVVFNIYYISWNTDIANINITIEDLYGTFAYTFDSNHSGWDYTQGTWTGITLNLNRASKTNDNNFEFIIGGTFDGTVDIVADAYFIRDSLNVQYSKFNVSSEISLLTETEGWAISNITFEISNCYYTSNWSVVDLSSLTNLNITTNEGFTYSLDIGYSNGTGFLTIDNRVIYPIGNQFLFTIESEFDVIFNTVIKVDYIQEFYVNQFLETFNLTTTIQGIINGGTFQLSAVENSWNEQEVYLWVTGIINGITYFYPSEVAMSITIGSQTYSILDFAQGTGRFSLAGFTKNQILQATIDISSPVNFSLLLSIEYLREVSYEIVSSLSYAIVEASSIFGTVQYNLELGYYLKTITTSLLDADEYTVRFSINKDHYISVTKDLELIVLNRPTLLNSSSEFFRKIENIYVKDAVNFTFVYTDALSGNKITNLRAQYYIWESYDQNGNVIDIGQGDIISTLENSYILDFNTETMLVGEYLLVLTMDKDNYDRKNGMILLTINKRVLNYSLGANFKDYKSNVVQGRHVLMNISLTDPTQGGIPLINATVKLTIGGNIYEFVQQTGNITGIYIFELPTNNINTFFRSETLTGIINITREDYISEEFTIIIIVEMEQIFFGIPTFYFLLIISAVVALVGSIAGYRIYQNARIPTFVKRVREMEKAIKKSKSIPESVLYRNKNVFVAERVNHKWEKLGLSLGEILDTEGDKIKKVSRKERRISETVKEHELQPIGLVLMKWDERIGAEILAKYPEKTVISEKTLMQIYGTHEYSGDKGIITLTAGSLNIISYYSGPETGYYLLLILNLDDDPDLYEGGMADTLRVFLENIEDDSYYQLMPSLFQRLSIFPSLTDEQILALSYQDGVKHTIIDNLRDIGLITKSELAVWLKDKFVAGFLDLESTLSEMLKKEFIKQVSVKGIPSDLIVLINDIFMLRVPPVELYKDPVNHGLPVQFTKEYLAEVKKFFQNYHPTTEDNLRIVDILINTEVYQILRLLRTTITSRQDLEKLQKKGVGDIYGALKLLYDAGMIKVFQDENNNEYYALLTDIYLDLIFPKYLLKVIKLAYDQKSVTNKALIEYLEILEDIYFELKSKKKS